MMFGTPLMVATGVMSRMKSKLTDHEEYITIGGRANHRLGTDVAAGTRPVLDDEWLTESLREPLPREAREDVAPLN
jgi:hypothetical protein